MPILADFPRAMSLGFAQGTQMAEGQNPLGQFIRMMLADWQQKRQTQAETEGQTEIEIFKSSLKEKGEIAREERKQKSPLYQAKTRAEEALAKKREAPPPEIPPWRQTGVTELGRSKILGSLKAKFYRHPLANTKLPLRYKEDAIDYILTEGYTNYEQDPEIRKIIDNLPSKNDLKSSSKKTPEYNKEYFHKKYNLQ